MALTSPTRHGAFPLSPSPLPRATENARVGARSATRTRPEGVGHLRLRRSYLIAIGLFAPLAAALLGFVLQQDLVADFPLAPSEAVVRGRLLDAGGAVLADGPVNARQYPFGSLAANVIGFTGRIQPDGRYGLEGLEYFLDARLAAGFDVSLTLDTTLQAAAERHLAQAASDHGAESLSAVVLEVGSGRILAAASYPSYDPNDFAAAGRDQMANRPFTQVYEPGSVVKPLIVAGLLESGRLLPTEIVPAPMTLRVGDKTFRDVARHEPELNVADVLAFSSNSAMIHLGQRFSPAELYDWMMRFGIGQPLDLASTFTRTGILNPWHRWVPQDQAANSIGQNLSATPLQLAAAYSIIANEGIYVPPRLVESETVPEPHRVLSPEVAQGVRAMLSHVMDTGGLRAAGIPGVRVAGKTGTADIFDTAAGAYLPGQYALTFVGMFPADRPQVVVVVVVNRPKEGSTSTYTAAPIFRAIGSEVVASWGIAPPANLLAGQ